MLPHVSRSSQPASEDDILPSESVSQVNPYLDSDELETRGFYDTNEAIPTWTPDSTKFSASRSNGSSIGQDIFFVRTLEDVKEASEILGEEWMVSFTSG